MTVMQAAICIAVSQGVLSMRTKMSLFAIQLYVHKINKAVVTLHSQWTDFNLKTIRSRRVLMRGSNFITELNEYFFYTCYIRKFHYYRGMYFYQDFRERRWKKSQLIQPICVSIFWTVNDKISTVLGPWFATRHCKSRLSEPNIANGPPDKARI